MSEDYASLLWHVEALRAADAEQRAELSRLRAVAEAAEAYREEQRRQSCIVMGEPRCDETHPIYKEWHASFLAGHQREIDTRAALDAAIAAWKGGR